MWSAVRRLSISLFTFFAFRGKIEVQNNKKYHPLQNVLNQQAYNKAIA